MINNDSLQIKDTYTLKTINTLILKLLAILQHRCMQYEPPRKFTNVDIVQCIIKITITNEYNTLSNMFMIAKGPNPKSRRSHGPTEHMTLRVVAKSHQSVQKFNYKSNAIN